MHILNSRAQITGVRLKQEEMLMGTIRRLVALAFDFVGLGRTLMSAEDQDPLAATDPYIAGILRQLCERPAVPKR
jgi:hypothetical protein